MTKVNFFNKPHQKHYISKDEEDDLKTNLLSNQKPLVYIRVQGFKNNQ